MSTPTNSKDLSLVVAEALREAAGHVQRLADDDGTHKAVARAAAILLGAFQSGGRVFACGNGGSMSDAMHFAEELSGRYRETRVPLPAVAICDPAYLSCVANDFGYEVVFSRFIEAFGRPGDVLVAISTSGTSPNVIRAVRAASARELSVVSLTGKADSPVAVEADVAVVTPGGRYADHVQEQHIVVLHALVDAVERGLAPLR